MVAGHRHLPVGAAVTDDHVTGHHVGYRWRDRRNPDGWFIEREESIPADQQGGRGRWRGVRDNLEDQKGQTR